MPSLSPHRPKPYQRRALALLVGCGSEGCSEYVMRMHGFTADQLTELVRVGFAVTTIEHVIGERQQPPEVRRLKITEAGNQALKRKSFAPAQ